MNEKHGSRLEGVFYRLAHAIWLCCNLVGLLRVKVIGAEHLPINGAALIAPCHESAIDPMIVAKSTGRKDHSFVAKSTLWGYPVVGWVMRTFRQIPVDRVGGGNSNVVTSAVGALKSGRAVVVFPQGRVERFLNRRLATKERREPQHPELVDSEGIEIRRGVAEMSLRADVPIIPTYVKTRHIRRAGAAFYRFAPWRSALVVYGEPFGIKDIDHDDLDLARPADRIEAGRRLLVAWIARVEALRQQYGHE